MVLETTKLTENIKSWTKIFKRNPSTPVIPLNELNDNSFPLNKLKKGQSGKIVYIKSSEREKLNKILAMGVLPGREVKVIKTYPSNVFQMEHTQIAVDDEIAESIFVGGRYDGY